MAVVLRDLMLYRRARLDVESGEIFRPCVHKELLQQTLPNSCLYLSFFNDVLMLWHVVAWLGGFFDILQQ